MDAPLALYRRYRPETFAEMRGQDHVTEPLRNALANNRVNHAYLFSGPRGCGKTTSARILARAMNCEKGPAPEPCGECQSCRDLARGGPGSIDVIEIDAASHGGVDDARDLRERAFFAPVQSRFKIYIIDEAHMVTTQGFNALLKLVEEPPPHLKFIFATTEPDKVIGTIRSRTHHYPIRLLPPKVLGAYIAELCEAEGVSIEAAALPLVVRAGAGSVRDSLSVLDQLIGGAGPDGVTYALAVALLGYTPDSLLDAIVDGFAAHDAGSVFGVIDKVIETGQDPKRFAEDLLRRLRDLVIVAAVPMAVSTGLIEVAEDQGERLQAQASMLGPAELTRAADTVAAGLLDMRGATAPRLQLELICAKVLLPGADDTARGVHARLDRVERRIMLGTPSADPDQPLSLPQGGASLDIPPPPVRDETPPPQSSRTSARQAVSRKPTTTSSSSSSDDAPPSSGAEETPAIPPPPKRDPAPSPAQDTPASSPPPASSAPSTPEAATPQPSPADEPSQSEPDVAGGGAGQIGLADVRRLWPAILDRVKDRKKVTWVMLSQNAQVLAMDDSTLTIGLSHAGVRDNFIRSGHDDILREAMRDELLVDRRIEAVVDPSTGGGSAAPAPGGPAPASGGTNGPDSGSSPWPVDEAPVGSGPTDGSSWDQPSRPAPSPQQPDARQQPASASRPTSQPQSQPQSASQSASRSTDRPGEREGGQNGSAASKRRAAEAAALAEQAERAARTVVAEQQPEPVDDEDVFREDDVVLEEDARSHTELLGQVLGAKVIDEQPNA